MHEQLFSMAIAMTVGACVGGAIGIYFKVVRPSPAWKERTEKQVAFLKKRSTLISSLTFLVLGIGLVWTLYYMLLGLLDPAQTEYATNVSQLIVSVLTVFSIMVAFYQFLREK